MAGIARQGQGVGPGLKTGQSKEVTEIKGLLAQLKI